MADQRSSSQQRMLFQPLSTEFYLSNLFDSSSEAPTTYSPANPIEWESLFTANVGSLPQLTGFDTQPLPTLPCLSNPSPVDALPSSTAIQTDPKPIRTKRKATINLEDREDRARERIIRNRQAAQESRERKKLQNENLQEENQRLKLANVQLSARLETIERSNQNLIVRLDHLSQQLSLLVSTTVHHSDSNKSVNNPHISTASTIHSHIPSTSLASPALSPESVAVSSSLSTDSSIPFMTPSISHPTTVSDQLSLNLINSIPLNNNSVHSQSIFGTCESEVFADPQMWVPINGLPLVLTIFSSPIQARLTWQVYLYLARSLLPSLLATVKSLPQHFQTTSLPCLSSTLDSNCNSVKKYLAVVDGLPLITLPSVDPFTTNWIENATFMNKGRFVAVQDPLNQESKSLNVHEYVTSSHLKWRKQFPISSDILNDML
ncbi:expressed protein [Batrachochytrium dendrobatidis JAM81]|uniref:Expressed protein n=2 Tax=Batrachochytrium dendrobatidis TaxID=109871 RepID=F4NVK8_BATDJ|nr:transcription factor HAC1 [Batrachochytrium dendrobatidis JAM81]EGF83291.1 expressed protein [Batrachochytrium dendrobatidis JAM81]OAJ36635.1 hypothetical protein BDEG_20789 [Batrachochytrium dendrobatidis JEL423]|eukprot:XP_006676047.1 expressed protein [Batrachochytrium dendrobatidis JAM81]